MEIDFFASERHYVDHLVPIWNEIDPVRRGTFVAHARLVGYLEARGVPAEPGRHPSRGGLVVVASHQDHSSAQPRPTILVNHGAGQTYGGDTESRSHPSYSDGPREGCVLFICPNDTDAERCRRANPGAEAVAVGSPRLDDVLRFTRREQGKRPRPVVAISFHWDCPLVPESRWAFPHYRDVIADLTADFDVIGHGHPRAWRALERFYRRTGIEPVESFDDVLERADLYVCDNSSSMYEFAASGPVLCLNAPWYRRSVDHGLRFWSHPPGLECNDAADLVSMAHVTAADPPVARSIRERALAFTYAFRDGQAAARAARAIEQLRPPEGAQVQDPREVRRRRGRG